METTDFSILEVIFSVALLATWLVAVVQLITIRKTLKHKYSFLDAEHEAEICLLVGDRDGYLRNYYRALYFYWIGSPYYASASNHELLKQEMRERYYNIIVKAGGTYPTKFIPSNANNIA